VDHPQSGFPCRQIAAQTQRTVLRNRKALLPAILLLAACAQLPPRPDLPEAVALAPASTTPLDQLAAPLEAEHPGHSAFRLVVEGTEAFVSRVQSAEELAELPLKFGAGVKPLLVKDVADVKIGTKFRTGAATLNATFSITPISSRCSPGDSGTLWVCAPTGHRLWSSATGISAASPPVRLPTCCLTDGSLRFQATTSLPSTHRSSLQWSCSSSLVSVPPGLCRRPAGGAACRLRRPPRRARSSRPCVPRRRSPRPRRGSFRRRW